MSTEPLPVEVVEEPVKKKRFRPKGTNGWPKGKPRHPHKIATTEKTSRIVELAMKGVGAIEIAKCVDVNDDVVSKVLQQFERVFSEMPRVATYDDCRKKLFSAAELSTLKLVVDPRKQEAATLRDAAFAFDRLYHAGRLERGLSTSNTATQTFIKVEIPEAPSE